MGQKLAISDRRNQGEFAKWVGAVKRYNGAFGYVRDVARRLRNLATEFVGYREVLTEQGVQLLGSNRLEQLIQFMETCTEAEVHSPVEFRLQDEQGHVSGVVNGVLISEIPNVDFVDESSCIIYGDANAYQFIVVGGYGEKLCPEVRGDETGGKGAAGARLA